MYSPILLGLDSRLRLDGRLGLDCRPWRLGWMVGLVLCSPCKQDIAQGYASDRAEGAGRYRSWLDGRPGLEEFL